MKVNYVKTVGFRKFKEEFETEIYDTTSITGKNRAGKSNILYAIINTMLGTNLSGNEKVCLINKKCKDSYGELHFTDNEGIKHVLIRGKNKYDNSKNFLSLDGKAVTQEELIKFYKDKKLFLSIINPLYFLTKKPADQKEMVDKYLSNIKSKEIFDRLTTKQQYSLMDTYFCMPIKEIYPVLSLEELQKIYDENNIKSITGKDFTEIADKDKWKIICENVKEVRGIKYYEMLSPEEKERFINNNMINICMYIVYNNLSKEEQNILEGMPKDIPTYITELNGDIKTLESVISTLNGKIEYARNISNQKLLEYKTFDKEEELSFAEQELLYLNSNEKIVEKEKKKQVIEELKKDILNKETEFNELEKEMKLGKKKYLSIKNGEVSTCPICNQHIQNESKNTTVSNMYNDLMSKYDKRNVLETQIKDQKVKLAMEKCEYHSLGVNTTVEKSKRITVVEENIRQLKKEKQDIDKFNSEISVKEKNVKEAKQDIDKFNKEKEAKIKLINSLIQAKKVAQKLYILYIEEKMKLAKQYLKDVDIKFYSVLKSTGEIKEDFIITYKNNTLSDLSRSETIATALEFANMFNKISKSNFPIFIDDYESCVDYNFIKEYAKDTQIILSKVEKGHLLKIADYNNADNYTVIKPLIKGYKTLKICKKNVANISQAA